MNYVLQQVRLGSYCAFKALDDATEILKTIGYKELKLNLWYGRGKIRKYAQTFFLSLRDHINIFVCVKKGDTVLIQWPLFVRLPHIYILYLKILQFRGVQFSTLVHDIVFARGDVGRTLQVSPAIEHFVLEKISKRLILHTPQMKSLLPHVQSKTEIQYLNCFDYLTNGQRPPGRQLSDSVVFAGNLMKSDFLKKLADTSYSVNLNLYGASNKGIEDHFNYCGKFEGDDVSEIQGSWGLVWDGKEYDTCAGDLGDYLKYNASHKFSLYIVAHLPVFVWSQSALADYVKEKNLGIVIDSILEIPEKIQQTTQEQYDSYLAAVKKEAQALTKGEHLKACIE